MRVLRGLFDTEVQIVIKRGFIFNVSVPWIDSLLAVLFFVLITLVFLFCFFFPPYRQDPCTTFQYQCRKISLQYVTAQKPEAEARAISFSTKEVYNE